METGGMFMNGFLSAPSSSCKLGSYTARYPATPRNTPYHVLSLASNTRPETQLQVQNETKKLTLLFSIA